MRVHSASINQRSFKCLREDWGSTTLASTTTTVNGPMRRSSQRQWSNSTTTSTSQDSENSSNRLDYIHVHCTPRAAGSPYLRGRSGACGRLLQLRRNAAGDLGQARPPEGHGGLEVRRRRVRRPGPQLHKAAVDVRLVRRQERTEVVVVDVPCALVW